MTRIQELERIIELKNQAIDLFLKDIETNNRRTEAALDQIKRSMDEIDKCQNELSRLQLLGAA